MFSSNQMFLSSLPGKGTCFSQAWVNEKEARKGWERNHGGKLPLVSKLCHGGHRLPSDEFITPMWCHFRLNQLDQGLPVSWKMLVLLTFLLIINSGQNRNNHYLRALESDIEHEKKKTKNPSERGMTLAKKGAMLIWVLLWVLLQTAPHGMELKWNSSLVGLRGQRPEFRAAKEKKKRATERGAPKSSTNFPKTLGWSLKFACASQDSRKLRK